MQRHNESLTNDSIDSVLPRLKQIKLYDGGGLFLLVRTNGSKLWRFRYHYHGKEKMLSFGSYP
jgi:hypothetical protein